jgi:hypothetical protein
MHCALLRIELSPIDGALLQVGEAEANDRLGLVEGVEGVLAPLVGRADDDPFGEAGLAEGGEEGVEVGFAERVLGEVELALDGPVFARAAVLGDEMLDDEVDADVADLALEGPSLPEPDFGEERRVERVDAEELLHHPLEPVAQVAVVACVVAELVEDGVELDAALGSALSWRWEESQRMSMVAGQGRSNQQSLEAGRTIAKSHTSLKRKRRPSRHHRIPSLARQACVPSLPRIVTLQSSCGSGPVAGVFVRKTQTLLEAVRWWSVLGSYQPRAKLMSKRKINSRALRQLAAELLEQAGERFDLSLEEREGLVTSLVRQWITYDGHATLFFEETQVFFHLGTSPAGRGAVRVQPGAHDWAEVLRRDWKVSDDDLRDLFRQLNVGQSAEVVNREGTPLRVWVDPKRGRTAVEPLVAVPRRPDVQRDYDRIARDVLTGLPGVEMDDEELAELGLSVVKQWREYDGHACIFLGERRQAVMRLTEKEDGGCNASVGVRGIEIRSVLISHGCPDELVSDALVRFNLGHKIEIRNSTGESGWMWYDPRAERVCIRPLGAQPELPHKLASIFCPHCTAVLGPLSAGAGEQMCPNCGRAVLREQPSSQGKLA